MAEILLHFKENEVPKENHPWNGITKIAIEHPAPGFHHLVLHDRLGGRHTFDVEMLSEIEILSNERKGDANV